MEGGDARGVGVGGWRQGVNVPRLGAIQSHDGSSPACRPMNIYLADWLKTLTTEEGEGGGGVGWGRWVGGYGVGVNAPCLDTIQSHDGGSPAQRPMDIYFADWMETLTTEEGEGWGGVGWMGGWVWGGGELPTFVTIQGHNGGSPTHRPMDI